MSLSFISLAVTELSLYCSAPQVLLPHAILLDGEDRLKNMFNVPLEFVALIVQSFRLSTSLLCRLY